MSETSKPTSEPLTMILYREDGLAHLPGPNPGTPYTVCGMDAGLMQRDLHPVYAAAMWCTDCLQISAGMRDA